MEDHTEENDVPPIAWFFHRIVLNLLRFRTLLSYIKTRSYQYNVYLPYIYKEFNSIIESKASFRIIIYVHTGCIKVNLHDKSMSIHITPYLQIKEQTNSGNPVRTQLGFLRLNRNNVVTLGEEFKSSRRR